MPQNCSERALSGASPRSNMLMIVIAALLVLLLTREGPGESSAMAQGSASGGLANPADQRNQMITELRRLNDEVRSLRELMQKPMRVEVVRMPEATASR